MMFYLMGLADIFVAGMLITNFKPTFLLAFSILFLLVKGILSFSGRPNVFLYIFGGVDLIAVLMLLTNISLGYFGLIILVIMVFKGFISFWKLKFIRDLTLAMVYIPYLLAVRGRIDAKWKEKVVNYLWFGRGQIDEKEPYIIRYPIFESYISLH
ncbi:MAG: hypothetical protein J7K73_00375 [Nanoarchaeota archaeon]|nr:hypothetical protein [Nanoarchaeota archaeon]